DQHRVALGLLQICGWTDLYSQEYIPQVLIAGRFRQWERKMYEQIAIVQGQYGIRKPPLSAFMWQAAMKEDKYVEGVIKYINKVVGIMYGVAIVHPSKKEKSLYKLQHMSIFTLRPDDTSKPFLGQRVKEKVKAKAEQP